MEPHMRHDFFLGSGPKGRGMLFPGGEPLPRDWGYMARLKCTRRENGIS